jgi:hypothetical protein
MGEAERAERAPLPAQAEIGIGTEGWLTQFVDYFQLKARYVLLIDNLFDLSHLDFIHASIIGSTGFSTIDPKIEYRKERLVVSRVLKNVETDCYNNNRLLFPTIGDRVTSRLETELISISLINSGGPTYNGSDSDAPLLGHQNFIHGLTPETEHSTHYWILMSRDFRVDDEALSAALAESYDAIDEPSLNQQSRLEAGDFGLIG